MSEKSKNLIFIIAFLIVSLIPLALMPLFGNQKSAESDAPEIPKIFIKDDVAGKDKESEHFNTNIMSDTGDYFARNFAFRQELITAGDLLKGSLFGVSGQKGVIMGREGWMFFANTFDDFKGVSTLSDYRISSSIHNLGLIQKRLEEEGIRFAFTISPNKNSLYPEKMDGGYVIEKEKRNSSRLIKGMKKNGISYIDLYHLFNDQKEVLYHRTDSHWNNKGAAMVSKYIKECLGHKATDWTDETYKEKYDFQGDLAAMVYPKIRDRDMEVYYNRNFSFDYTGVSAAYLKDPKNDKDKITEENEIETENPAKEGSLVMLRDSFGNSLTPFMAEDYRKGLFLNKTPYSIQPAVERKADAVVFELVERNLSYLTSDAPELDMGKEKIRTVGSEADDDYKGTVNATLSDSMNFNKVYGNLDPSKTNDDTKIYIRLTPVRGGGSYTTRVFRTTRYGAGEDKNKDYGYATYIGFDTLQPGDYSAQLIYGEEGSLKITDELGNVSFL